MRIAYRVARQIADHALAAAPNEACGLLAGHAGIIRRAVPLQNVSETPSQRFQLDPAEELRALKSLDAEELEWLGVYHSHPSSAPIPSQSDLAEAADAMLLHLIVSLERAKPQLKLWRIDGDSAEPVELVFESQTEQAEDGKLTQGQRIALVLAGLASLLLLVMMSIALLPPPPELVPPA